MTLDGVTKQRHMRSQYPTNNLVL